MKQNYETLELLIGQRNNNGYPITVVQSPSGDANAISQLAPQELEFQDALQALELGDTDQDFLMELGNYLFNELLVGDVATRYRESLSAVRTQQKGLRLRLRIEPPELAALPWEYIYDHEEDAFLAIAQETALVRYVPVGLPARPTQSTLPLRILVVIANPTDLTPLDLIQERRIIQDALAEREAQGQVKLFFVDQATVENVSQAMRTFQPHVFHFVGHGLFEGDEASVILEDEQGRAKPINERTFREFFSASNETRLAVLNACQSATVSASQLLVGLAPRLLQRKLSAAVAMQYPISDRASLIFAREFYRTLAAGGPVEAAVAQARKGIYQEVDGQSNEWGTPVLFLRAKDGQLIEWTEEKPKAEPDIPAPPEPRQPPMIPNFVGRAAELEYYAQRLQERGMALINGMAGVGKSTLAAQLARMTAPPGRILWYEFQQGDSMLAFIWQLAGFLAWNGQDKLWKMLHHALQADRKLPPPNVLADYVMQQLRVGHYLICLDDFHLVYDTIDDDPVLGQFLERLNTIVAEGHIQLIIASRSYSDFAKLVSDYPLKGLSRSDATQILQMGGVTLSANLIAQLHDQTEGNAQLLILAAQSLQQTQNPERLIRNLAMSPQIDNYLLQELDAHLSPKQQQIMYAISLFQGHPATRGAIEHVLAGDNARRTLGGLVSRHLLLQREGEVGSEYTQHAIVREFYYDLLDQAERHTMHHRAGEYYELEEESLLPAARHYLQGDAAAQAAALLTPNVQMLINQGKATSLSTLLGQFKVRRLEPMAWVDVNIARGEVATFLRHSEPAKSHFQTVLGLLERLPEDDEVRLRSSRGYRGMGTILEYENPQEALKHLKQGLAVLENVNVDEAIQLQLKLSSILIHLAKYDEAQSAAQIALDLLPNSYHERRTGALINLGGIRMIQSDFTEAADHFEEALLSSQKNHQHFQTATILMHLGYAKHASGEWLEANNFYQQALDLAKQLGHVLIQLNVQNSLGMLHTRQGNHEKGLKYLTDAVEVAQAAEMQTTLIYILSSLATLHIQQQSWDKAILCLNQAESIAIDMEINFVLVEININWSRVALSQRQTDQALSRINRALKFARQLEMTLEEGIALRILGQTYGAIGRERDSIVVCFQKSLDLLMALDRYEVARTQTAWGEWLYHHDHEQAQVLLQNAYTIFRDLGAAYDLAYVEALIPCLG